MGKLFARNWLTIQDRPKRYEKNTKPGETIPGQAMSVAELYRRMAAGLPVEGYKVPLFEFVHPDDETFEGFPDPETLDLADRQALAELARAQLKEIKDQANQRAAEIKARKEAQAAQKAAQKAQADKSAVPKDEPKNESENDSGTNNP